MNVWMLMMGLFVGLVVLFLTLYAATRRTNLRVLGNECPDIIIPAGCSFGAERRQNQNGCIYFACSTPKPKGVRLNTQARP